MRIVAMADTHGYHDQLVVPDGDILIHAGDITQRGSLAELARFNQLLARLPHRHKLVIASNHDFCFQDQPEAARKLLTAATYLQDDAVEVDGLRCYGSPWQPWFFDWAFNLPRGEQLAERWSRIPEDTDVLITHGPPLGFGDWVARGERVGCEDLLRRIEELSLRLHVFGHIHEGRGSWHLGRSLLANVTVDEGCQPPTVIELSGGKVRVL